MPFSGSWATNFAHFRNEQETHANAKLSNAVTPPRCLRKDMVDVKSCLLANLRKLAIFTPIVCTSDDFGSQPRGEFAHGLLRSDRNFSKLRNSAKLTKPSASPRSALLKACPASWRSSNDCNLAATASGNRNRSISVGNSSSNVKVIITFPRWANSF